MKVKHNNLYDPVMYLIDKNVKRHFNKATGGSTSDSNGTLGNKQFIEPITLSRDSRGRLNKVDGYEYLTYELTYKDNGLLEVVDVTHKLTGKHLQITLEYDSRRLLTGVTPVIVDEGNGDPGEINIPDVIADI
jgi:hypothetical protein